MRVPVLKNKLVTLRPPRMSDAPNYCAWFANPEVTRFLERHEDPPTLREERKFLLEQPRIPNLAFWVITTPAGEHIGSVSLMKIDREHGRAEYGIMIGDPRYWGQGYGTAAGRLVVRFGFRQLKLQRISLLVYAYNTRAYRSYRRLGFRREGRLRDHFYRDGVHHDAFVMGILRREYLSLFANANKHAKRKKR